MQEAKKEARLSYHNEYSQNMREALSSGNAPWQKPIPAERDAAINGISGKQYRGVNQIALEAEEKKDPRWLTFNQIKYTKGLKLKKGSDGVRISY